MGARTSCACASGSPVPAATAAFVEGIDVWRQPPEGRQQATSSSFGGLTWLTTVVQPEVVGCYGVEYGSGSAEEDDICFEFQLTDCDGHVHAQGTVSGAELEHAAPELVRELQEAVLAGRPCLRARDWKDALQTYGSALPQLQQLLDKWAATNLALQRLLQLPRAENLWCMPRTASLEMLVDCFTPMLSSVASYVASSPRDLVRFCNLTSRSVAKQLRPMSNDLWEQVYAREFHAFYDCQKYMGATDWRAVYLSTLVGQTNCLLEVFEREKKVGFAMSAWPARVHYDMETRCFIARYFSASDTSPESIPAEGWERLRFCPAMARSQLKPGRAPREVVDPEAQLQWSRNDFGIKTLPTVNLAHYPYKVLTGTEGLEVGMAVELQWKTQQASPFGWWFGHLEELRRHSGGALADATIVFKHFPDDSHFKRLFVTFGDDTHRPDQYGGFTGGIRPVAPEKEVERWMQFFPKKPVVI